MLRTLPAFCGKQWGLLVCGLGITAFSSSVLAGGKQVLEEIVVTAQHMTEVGVADSANVGTVTQEQLAARTVYRPGELLETTPGLIVSQHSGEGKANQYYLRGFNLDHGTDLRTSVDEMLVNERSHSHGQGWTDLNFLIPELATELEYNKGPYYASEGDFASAGAVSVNYANTLARGIASIGVGQNGFKRMLVADSPGVAGGHLLYARTGTQRWSVCTSRRLSEDQWGIALLARGSRRRLSISPPWATKPNGTLPIR